MFHVAAKSHWKQISFFIEKEEEQGELCFLSKILFSFRGHIVYFVGVGGSIGGGNIVKLLFRVLFSWQLVLASGIGGRIIVYHHGNLHHHDKNFNFCVVVVLTLLTGQTRHRLRNRESKVCVHCRTLREYFILIRYLISYDHGISITITIIMIFVYVLTLSTGQRRQRLWNCESKVCGLSWTKGCQ